MSSTRAWKKVGIVANGIQKTDFINLESGFSKDILSAAEVHSVQKRV
jgi:hypothetical protein